MTGALQLPTRHAQRLPAPVSVIGWGAFKIGRNEGIKYPTPYDLPSDAEADRLIHAVIEMGVGVIDTAPAYGLSEARLGASLGSAREQIFLSTKAGERFDGGRSTYDFSERAVHASVAASLERLRTDRVDCVWVHSDGTDLAILRDGGAIRALAAARERGEVRSIGFSPKTLDGAMTALDDARVDALMVELHPRETSMLPAVQRAGAEGRAVFVKKPLASGHLAPAEAIPWILRHPEVTCVVVGGLNAERLRATAALARA